MAEALTEKRRERTRKMEEIELKILGVQKREITLTGRTLVVGRSLERV